MVMMTILIEHGYWKPTNQSGFILDHDIKIMKRIFDDHDKDHDNQDHHGDAWDNNNQYYEVDYDDKTMPKQMNTLLENTL